MAAQHDDIEWVIIKGIILVIGNYIAHNINNVLHVITAVLTILYLLWRWRRDWRKDKAERNERPDNTGKA